MDSNSSILVSRTPKFAGTEQEDWDKWLSRFEGLTFSYKDEERLRCLVSLLEGGALDAALPSLKQNKNYAAVKADLSSRFGRLPNSLQAQAEFGRAVQAPGESAEYFADRLRRLAQLAHPTVGDDNVLMESSLCSRFICGLRDQWLQTKLCNRGPATLVKAVQMVRDLRSRQEAVQAVRRSVSENEDRAASATVSVPSINAGDNNARQMDRLEQQMSELRSTVEALVVTGTDRSSRGSSDPSKIVCYGCGSLGHMRRDCLGRQRGSAPRNGTCHACGLVGHYYRDCPQFRGSSRSPQPFCLCCGRSGHWLAACRSLPRTVDRNTHANARSPSVAPAFQPTQSEN